MTGDNMPPPDCSQTTTQTKLSHPFVADNTPLLSTSRVGFQCITNLGDVFEVGLHHLQRHLVLGGNAGHVIPLPSELLRQSLCLAARVA